MPSLRERTEAALDSRPAEQGVIVALRDGTLLAERDPMPGSGAYVVVLDAEPLHFRDDAPWAVRRGNRYVIGRPAHSHDSGQKAEDEGNPIGIPPRAREAAVEASNGMRPHPLLRVISGGSPCKSRGIDLTLPHRPV